jgi:hypothetical protein
MLPARRVAKAALPPALPAAGTPGQNLPAPVAPAGPLMRQWPASPTQAPASAWREGPSGERTDDYTYGPGTSRGPSSAGSFGGGAYHGPTTGGHSQHAPGADYAESAYVEPQGFQAPEHQTPDNPAYGGRHRSEGYGGQGPQHWQGGYQGGGFVSQQPAPPPVPPNAQGYPDQPAAGYPGPTGGYSAQAAPQFGNGYPGPGRPAADFPPPNGFPAPPTSPPPSGPPPAAGLPPVAGPPPATGYTPPANGFPPQGSFPPGNGFPPQGSFPPANGFPPQESFPPANGFPPQESFPPANGFPPPAGFPSPPVGSPSAPPGGFQSPPAGSPFPPPGFPSPPRPGEFQGFPPPNIPGGQPPGFGGQQAEGFQQTAAFPGSQPGQPPFAGAQFGQVPFGGPAAPTATAATPWYQRLGSGNPRLLIGGAVAVVVVVGGVALAVPKLFGTSDPGCASYTGTALTAYNRTINDLNAQASQSQLTSDMTSAIADLTTAADQAKSATVKSALDGLSGELSTVRADVQRGSVSAQTVASLNSASRAADNAC